MSSPQDLGSLDAAQWRQLHELANRFEEAYKSRDRVEITEFLPDAADPLRPWALHELIKSDLEICWRNGKQTVLEDYVASFPELGSMDKLPPQLICEEYWIRKSYGDQPQLLSYQSRFPKQFAELENLVQETNMVDGASGTSSPDAPSLAESATEDTILPIGGGYKLLEPLGKGNFGQVWKAEAPGGKLVALKILYWSVDHPAAQRELQSLELLKQLNHTYLLDIHAYHTLENGLVIVTGLADGNLSNRLKQCRAEGHKGIPVEELLGYMMETAEVLDFLNAQGIQHRDIKPENLLIAQGHMAVGDLGLARFLEESRVQASVLGTPGYMAPEVWLATVHTNSDQYSLAVTYLELRRGKCPFRSANLQGILPEHLGDSPELETLTDTERTAILKAGAKEPEKRYPSCQAFVQDLQKALQGSNGGPAYTKSKRIGKGAFGEVWQGEAPGGIPVAIKVIALTAGDKTQSEADALELIKKLSHPYLVKMYAFWIEDDELQIAMELADKNLADRLHEVRAQGQVGIPRSELLRYMRQAAEGLDYLHEQQVLHRDIKPENILLQGEFAKIGDFGVARFLEAEHLFTATTSGTMSYMPPEAWHGQYSVHSDQYSLAHTYAEMRQGKRLFSFGSMADAMKAHVHMDPPLTSFSYSEQQVLRKALAKQPEDRYSNCTAFIEALEQAAANSPEEELASNQLSQTLVGGIASAEMVKTDDPTDKLDWRAAHSKSDTKFGAASPRSKKKAVLLWILVLAVPLLTLSTVLIVIFMNQGGEPQPQPFLPTTPNAGERYALLIGVPRPGPNLPDFLHAEADVETLGRTLIATGYNPINVHILTQTRSKSRQSARPTKDNILTVLRLLGEQCVQDDVLLLALIGHQVQFPIAPGQNYFCSDECQLLNQETLLSMDDVYDALAKCKARSKIVFLDGWRHAWPKQLPRPLVKIHRQRQSAKNPNGTTVFFSCQLGGESYDLRQNRHGTFCYFVNRGLQGAADTQNQNGQVTFSELTDYVNKNVKKYVSQKYNAHQQPQLWLGGKTLMGGDVILANVSPALKVFDTGVRQLEEKQYKEAITTLTRAEQNSKPPFLAEIYLQRSEAFYHQNDYDKVIEDAKRVFRSQPHNATAYDRLADAFAAKKKYVEALTYHDKAIALAPSYALAYWARALTHKATDNFKNALSDLEKALALHPALKEIHASYGNTNLQMREFRKALNAYNKALELDPHWTEVKKLRDQVKKHLAGGG